MLDAGGAGPSPFLAPSVENLADALSHLPDAVLIVDGEARVQWANPATTRLIGVDVAEWIGKSGLDLVHPDDLEMALVSLASVQGKEVGTPIELRLKTGRGWRLFEVIGAPLTGTDEGALVLSLRDLTARRRWEVARDEVSKFRSLVHNAASLTLFVLPDGEVESASGALTRMLGHDPEAVLGRPMLELVTLADRAEVERAMAAAAAGPQGADGAVVVEARLITRKTGTPVVPFELTIVNLVDDPTLSGFVVSGHDVSDRKAKDDALNGALSLLHATLDSTADGLLVVDDNGHIVSFNKKFADMWRLPAEVLETGDDNAAIACVIEQVVDAQAFAAKIRELYSNPEAESFDTLDFKDGRVFERYSTPQRVDGAIVGRVWSFRDVTETKHLEKQLAHQAFHDALTNLPNQTLFRDRVDHALERVQRSSGDLAVLFIDLDNFKTVNDSLGHPAGDALLAAVTERLQGCLRGGDTAARLGGDEFAVLLEDIESVADAIEAADRIIDALQRPFRVASNEVFTSGSIGIALNDSASGSDQLLRNADLAMYTAKARGKGRYDVFEAQMHAAAVERLEVEADLRRAHDGNELVVYYQPIVELATGRIVALETLVRWKHPTRGLLLPHQFVPIAEETGLIKELGRRVLLESCDQLREWQQRLASYGGLAVSVNLSPSELADPRLRGYLADVLDRTGIDPTTLLLEITEGAMMRDADSTVANLWALKELGVRLAVDDFGTGYSSLTYLQRFPVDVLKIDRAFVSGAAKTDERGLVPAIVRLADTMNMQTVAEGVETCSQADAVRAAGCHMAQGYFYSLPQPAEGVTGLLAAHEARLAS
jgi:diguanylate cyclase (GGDEF)-like protein/PAS domain S-box-containing protein